MPVTRRRPPSSPPTGHQLLLELALIFLFGAPALAAIYWLILAIGLPVLLGLGVVAIAYMILARFTLR